jgi:small subunit ribosomal protein S4
MSRYTGPRLKKMRGLATDLPGLSRKSTSSRPYPPGEHGNKRRGKDSEYKKQLQEKQKLRFNYGVHERQLRKLMKEARRSKTSTGEKLLQFLESRLDSVVFRSGLAATIPGARQLVNHGHVRVNGQKVDVASYRVKVGDVIELKPKARNSAAIAECWKHPAHERPAWVNIDTHAMSARVDSLPTTEAMLFPIDINLVLEYYAKRM